MRGCGPLTVGIQGESTVGKLGNWKPDPFYKAFADLGWELDLHRPLYTPGLDLIVHTNHFWLVRGSTKCFEKTPKHLLLLGLAPQLHRSLFLSASLRVQSLPALGSNSTHIIFMLSLRYSHKLHINEPFPMVTAEV